jgi:hypothetical protein
MPWTIQLIHALAISRAKVSASSLDPKQLNARPTEKEPGDRKGEVNVFLGPIATQGGNRISRSDH